VSTEFSLAALDAFAKALGEDVRIEHNDAFGTHISLDRMVAEHDERVRHDGWRQGVQTAVKWLRDHPGVTGEHLAKCLLGLYGMSESYQLPVVYISLPTVVECPVCTRIGPHEHPVGPLGFCAQCWLGENRKVRFVPVR
jgi:hypothetical protein